MTVLTVLTPGMCMCLKSVLCNSGPFHTVYIWRLSLVCGCSHSLQGLLLVPQCLSTSQPALYRCLESMTSSWQVHIHLVHLLLFCRMPQLWSTCWVGLLYALSFLSLILLPTSQFSLPFSSCLELLLHFILPTGLGQWSFVQQAETYDYGTDYMSGLRHCLTSFSFSWLIGDGNEAV